MFETSLRLCHTLDRQHYRRKVLSAQQDLRYDNCCSHCMLKEFINFLIIILQSMLMPDDENDPSMFYTQVTFISAIIFHIYIC
jgi:hypothetical protein